MRGFKNLGDLTWNVVQAERLANLRLEKNHLYRPQVVRHDTSTLRRCSLKDRYACQALATLLCAQDSYESEETTYVDNPYNDKWCFETRQTGDVKDLTVDPDKIHALETVSACHTTQMLRH